MLPRAHKVRRCASVVCSIQLSDALHRAVAPRSGDLGAPPSSRAFAPGEAASCVVAELGLRGPIHTLPGLGRPVPRDPRSGRRVVHKPLRKRWPAMHTGRRVARAVIGVARALLRPGDQHRAAGYLGQALLAAARRSGCSAASQLAVRGCRCRHEKELRGRIIRLQWRASRSGLRASDQQVDRNEGLLHQGSVIALDRRSAPSSARQSRKSHIVLGRRRSGPHEIRGGRADMRIEFPRSCPAAEVPGCEGAVGGWRRATDPEATASEECPRRSVTWAINGVSITKP